MKKYITIETYFNNLYNHIEKIIEEYPFVSKAYLDNIKKPRTIEGVVKQCSEITKTLSYEIKKENEKRLMDVKELENSMKKLDNQNKKTISVKEAYKKVKNIGKKLDYLINEIKPPKNKY